MTDLRPFNVVAMKASHNTFETFSPPFTTMTSASPSGWAFHAYDEDCRAIELDVAQMGGRVGSPGVNWQWSVQHEGDYDPRGRQLSQFLADLRGWHQGRPQHEVVTVFICLRGIKDKVNFPTQLDAYISSYLCGNDLACVYRPSELLADTNADTLRGAALIKGWPTVAMLQGRFILAMTGDEIETYAKHPADRLGFACAGVKLDATLEEWLRKPNQLIINGDIERVNVPRLKQVSSDPSVLVRGYVVGHNKWQWALDAGINFVATNDMGGTGIPGFVDRRRGWQDVAILVSQGSGRVLDVKGKSSKPAEVQQWDWLQGSNQKWRIEPAGQQTVRIVSVNSGLVLDVEGSADGARVWQRAPTNGQNQKWWLERLDGKEPLVAIRNVDSKKMLEVMGESTRNGAAVEQWEPRDTPNQRWKTVNI